LSAPDGLSNSQELPALVMERDSGFEPPTFSLGMRSEHSTYRNHP
jgi:hypothetical protein